MGNTTYMAIWITFNTIACENTMCNSSDQDIIDRGIIGGEADTVEIVKDQLYGSRLMNVKSHIVKIMYTV